MLAAHDADPTHEDVVPRHVSGRDPFYRPVERHGYEAPKSGRVYGSVGTIAVCSLIAAGFLVTLDHFDRPAVVSAPLTMTLLTIASAPRPEPKKVDTPKPPQKTVSKPEPPEVDPLPRPLVSLPSPPAPVARLQRVATDPKPPTVESPPAPSQPAPSATPAQAPSSHGPDKWEGRVLARLARFRRYPDDARRARQQGTAYIRFRIDRDGHVLSSSLERSSGYPDLDAAAMETLRRADPLPKIPPDRPDQVELLVPIEFFMER
jgi:protein TonB